MTQSLATTNGAMSNSARLDPYAGGVSTEAPRVDALAIVSCGYRGTGEGNRPGLPKASRPNDERQIHLHDPLGRAPGLAAALEEGGHRQLLITFPLDDPRQFVIQRFTRYSASRLEAYGDETAITFIDNRTDGKPVHRRFEAGTAEYERLVQTCKADTRIYFCLAEWGPNGPEVVFPDGLGTYAIRTTSRHSVRSILGTLAYTARFTRGHIAGLPFLLTVDHREVAGPDGSKRMVPVWTITTKPPEGARLSSRTFRELATTALEQGAQLMLPAPDERTWEDMDADGPLVDEPSASEMEVLDQGGLCDADFYRRAWHALATGSVWASDAARASFIGAYTKDQTASLTEFLRTATERQATDLIAALGAAVERSRRSEHDSAYDRIFTANYGDDFTARPVVAAGGQDRPSVEPSSEAPASESGLEDGQGETRPAHDNSEAFHCSQCGAVILDQAGQAVNATQADTITQRYGKLICLDCRPKKAAKSATQPELA